VLGEDQIMGTGAERVRGRLAPAPKRRRSSPLARPAPSGPRLASTVTRGHLLDRALRLSAVDPGHGTLLVLGAGAMGRLIAPGGRNSASMSSLPGAASRQKASLALRRTRRRHRTSRVDVLAGCLGSGAGEIALRVLPQARLVIDLGTPRNFVEPEGPGLVTIADLLASEERLAHSRARRAELVARLATLLDERVDHAGTDSRSAIGRLRLEVESVRRREMARIRRLHPELSPELLDTITRSLLDQVFHAPTAKLRAGTGTELADQVADLFARPAEQPAERD